MSEYAWATGHGVADGGLTGIVSDLTTYNDDIDVVLRSQPVNRFPVRTRLASGAVRGDGFLNHTVTVAVLTREAMEYIQDTYLDSGASVSKAMTVRLRLHDRDTWARYNCYFELYNPDSDGDYSLGEFYDVQLRFHRLVAL